ncbi:MAG: DUF1559 domain-containing protein [Verrucomicrobia bacterium]|nr:DUF1559 domain-containing protein [Verrucomicrobiota bacterium]
MFSPAGFTLIELMMVISIVTILSLLLLPALQRSREKARGAVCANNMRQLSIAVFSYSSEREDELPWSGPAKRNGRGDWVFGGPGVISSKDESSWNAPGFAFHAESGSLMPYVTGIPREDVHNNADPRSWRVFRCPSTGDLGRSLRVNYALNGYCDPERRDPSFKKTLSDETSNMRLSAVMSPGEKVMFVNKAPSKMTDAQFLPSPSFSQPADMVQSHNDTANYSFFDGSIHPIPGNLMIEVMKAKNLADRYFDLARP